KLVFEIQVSKPRFSTQCAHPVKEVRIRVENNVISWRHIEHAVVGGEHKASLGRKALEELVGGNIKLFQPVNPGITLPTVAVTCPIQFIDVEVNKPLFFVVTQETYRLIATRFDRIGSAVGRTREYRTCQSACLMR